MLCFALALRQTQLHLWNPSILSQAFQWQCPTLELRKDPGQHLRDVALLLAMR